MKEIKSYYDLESEMSRLGYNHVLYEITELTRREALDLPRTTKKAQELIMNWWHNNKIKPNITSHRLGYFALYHLREECINK